MRMNNIVQWMTPDDPWYDYNTARYPIIGVSDKYVWSDYNKIDAKKDEGGLLELFHAHAVNPNACWTSLHRFCGQCYVCDDQSSKDFCDRDSCEMFPQYYFNEFRCARSNDVYFLITTTFHPYHLEEPDWMFIPAHPFNVQIFNTIFLGGMYHVGL